MGRPMGGALGSQHSMRGSPCSGVSASPGRLGVPGQMSPLAWGLRGRNNREKVRVVSWRRAVVVPACAYPREAESGIDPLRGLPTYGLRCSRGRRMEHLPVTVNRARGAERLRERWLCVTSRGSSPRPSPPPSPRTHRMCSEAERVCEGLPPRTPALAHRAQLAPPPGPAAATSARPDAAAARSKAASNSLGSQSMISAPHSLRLSGIFTPSFRRMPTMPLG